MTVRRYPAATVIDDGAYRRSLPTVFGSMGNVQAGLFPNSDGRIINNSTAAVANQLHIFPFESVHAPTLVNQISFYVGTAAASTVMRWGLYPVDSAGSIRNKLRGGFGVDMGTTGVVTDSFDELLYTPGWYVLALNWNGTPSLAGYDDDAGSDAIALPIRVRSSNPSVPMSVVFISLSYAAAELADSYDFAAANISGVERPLFWFTHS